MRRSRMKRSGRDMTSEKPSNWPTLVGVCAFVFLLYAAENNRLSIVQVYDVWFRFAQG